MTRKVFHPRVYRSILRKQRMKCALSGKRLKRGQIQFDHVVALALGGKDEPENLRAVTTKAHKWKTVADAKAIAKGKRIRARAGLRSPRLNKKDRYLARRAATPEWMR